MPSLAEHRIRISYTGGLAEHHALPGYDGATSIDGITRALHIIVHAYMTGEVVSRATALRNASIIIKPPRQGSFVFDIIAILEAYPSTTAAAIGLGGPVFYDFVKTALRRAVGKQDAEPETAHLRNLYLRKEPPPLKLPPADLDELSEHLEGSLQDAHRPIGDDGAISTITVGSPRTALVSMNRETKDWVSTREEAVGVEVFRGNVTRYNAISRNARAYIDQLGCVVPVRPNGDFPSADLAFLTWSLHGSNIGRPSKLDLHARRVSSASGRVKRLLLSSCQRAPVE